MRCRREGPDQIQPSRVEEAICRSRPSTRHLGRERLTKQHATTWVCVRESQDVRYAASLALTSQGCFWPGPAAPSPEEFLIRGRPATERGARSMARACRRSQSKWALQAPAQRSNRRQCRSCLAESKRTRRVSFHTLSKNAAAGRGSASRDETSRHSFSPPGEPQHFDQSRRRCRTRCPFAACSCCSDRPPVPREARSL
jgi:hypothetical protein